MIRWFYKYGFVILLLNTILYSIDATKDTIAPIIFYFLMGSGLFLLLINNLSTGLSTIVSFEAFLSINVFFFEFL